MLKRLFGWTGLFETNLSAAEWAWRLFTFAVVASGGTTAGLLAKGSELFAKSGPIVWLALGVLCSLLLATIFILIKMGNKQSAEAAYLRAMALRQSAINPVLESFTDQIISVPDLFLPRRQVHTNKQFKRCKFVGPGAIAILGGSYIRVNFHETGDIITLPDQTFLAGITVFENCTVEDCEFFGIALIMNGPMGEHFKKMRLKIASA